VSLNERVYGLVVDLTSMSIEYEEVWTSLVLSLAGNWSGVH